MSRWFFSFFVPSLGASYRVLTGLIRFQQVVIVNEIGTELCLSFSIRVWTNFTGFLHIITAIIRLFRPFLQFPSLEDLSSFISMARLWRRELFLFFFVFLLFSLKRFPNFMGYSSAAEAADGPFVAHCSGSLWQSQSASISKMLNNMDLLFIVSIYFKKRASL